MTETSADSLSSQQSADSSERAQELLSQLLEIMGYAVTVDVSMQDEHLQLDVQGEDASLLAGKKGQTLDALQYLLSKMLSREVSLELPLVIDSDGYRQRRQAALQELALQLSQKALETQQTVAINPMSAHDRRVIHVALREVEGVSTRSEGEGDQRRLLIVPEG